MKTKLLYILLFFVCIQTYGQRKYAADRYFNEYAYKKSAELYHVILKKGDSSKLVLERLGDSYYYNTDTEEAEKWYGKLLNNYQAEVLPEYYFRYAQVLKSNGKYNESDAMMKKFKSLQVSDTRAEVLYKIPNHISVFSDETDMVVNLHNVSINTKYSDYGGFEKEGKFYFASTKPKSSGRNRIYKWNNQPFYNLYEANIVEQHISGETNESKIIELTDQNILSDEINTRYHDASAILTKDGQTMYFTRDNYNGKKLEKDKNRCTHLKLYRASLVNGYWANVEELSFNSEDYSIGHPALSRDEKTLYFTSDMPGGLGATDIYKISLFTPNQYGLPENLGKPVNTEGREMFPFISQDDVLYFSSDGHSGLGALDIFETKIEGNTYTKVKNIGAPFNSKLDDFSFTLNKDKTKGFLSSNREGGKGDDDIYSFSILNVKPVLCTQNVTGIVTDNVTGNIIAQATVKLIDTNGAIIKTTQSDASGVYSFSEVDCKNSYKLLGEKKNYTSDRNSVSTTDILGETQKADLELTALIIGNEIVINPIFFDFDKFNIRAEAVYELEKIITVMNSNPEMVIKIESHTDSRATKAYNRKLSDNRAKYTRDYITSRGIASNRIASAIGYGESQLLNNCNDANQNTCTEEEHQRNRRSKFIIVSGNNTNIKVNDPSSVPLKKIDYKPGRN